VAALVGAVAAQRALAAEVWPAAVPIRVRVALHTGVCEERDGDYFGPTVNRVARLEAIAHGGQTVCSGVTADMIADRCPEGVSLVDQGEHRLKDLDQPIRVHQVIIDGLRNEFPPLRSLSSPVLQTNIGIQPSTFIGRNREIDALRDLLSTSRLVSIVGPGGAGKTRLAIQTAVELLDGSGDGVWLVELAPVSDPDRVASTVARVLGILEDPTRPTVEHLVDVCSDRDTLIVLDNCEHVIDTVAKLADRLLRECPNVELLATSREPLNIDGEQVYRLGALALPNAAETDVDTIAGCEAVQLFVDRAQRHDPTFALTDNTAPIVAAICRRLDGLPLAIELAAARLASMSLESLEARLDQRFRLLTGGSRTADARQQTLQGLIDWSWDLLTPGEQAGLARLGVCNGTFALDAAEAIITDGTQTEAREVFDVLGALVDKSLVHTTPTGRYHLLETIRDYVAARLDHDQSKRARRVHRGHYLELAHQAQLHFRTKDEDLWLERLDVDLDNLTAAIDSSLGDDEATTGLELATSLRDYWDNRGVYTYAADRVARLLDQAGTDIPPELRCSALISLARLHTRLGEYPAARRHSSDAVLLARSLGDRTLLVRALTAPGAIIDSPEAAVVAFGEALALARGLGDDRFIATALSATAIALMEVGRTSESRVAIGEALQTYERLGYQTGVAETLGIMAWTNVADGDLTTARQQFEAALDIYVDHPSSASEPNNQFSLGLVIHAQGHREEARMHFVESLAHARRTGSHNDVACALLGLALAAPEPRDAAMLHGAADTILEENDVALDPFETEYRTADHARLRARLGDTTFDERYERGRAMPRAQAINLALTATNET
jgi:predicted ATPase